MTQPAFSQRIRSLEDRIGVKLVDRTSRMVRPTITAIRHIARALAQRAADAGEEASGR